MRITIRDGREFVVYTKNDRQPCSFCGENAVVPLTPSQLAQQPDDTTHVCHPALDGCNQGFAVPVRAGAGR